MKFLSASRRGTTTIERELFWPSFKKNGLGCCICVPRTYARSMRIDCFSACTQLGSLARFGVARVTYRASKGYARCQESKNDPCKILKGFVQLDYGCV